MSYEQRDVNLKLTLAITAGVTIFLVVSVIAVHEYFLWHAERVFAHQVYQPKSAALTELRAREARELGGVRILDEEKGVYAIPIEVAMEKIVLEYGKK
jgi:NADH:ubiquinone oxidoreductase subunit 4 (subunit M)